MEADEVQQLREGEREHGEVDPAPPQAQVADDGAAHDGEGEARPQPQPEGVHLQLRERDAGAVGAEAVVRGMAERQEARVAVEHVEAEGEEAEDQDLGGERLVGHQEGKDGEEDHEAEHRPRGDGARQARDHSISPASPKRPLGRTSSTTAITTKTMISASLGAKYVVRLTTSPMRMPATMAPEIGRASCRERV